MTTNYTPVDEATILMAKKIVAEWHPWLRDARITIVLRVGEPPKQDGKMIFGAASLVDAKTKALAAEKYDFFIWLAADHWEDAKEKERKALLDHELCHCTGAPLAWKMRGHDVQEFTAIVQRHGLWYPDLDTFVGTATGDVTPKPIYQLDLSVVSPIGKVGTLVVAE